MIDRIREQLIIDEGMALKPYYCPAGYLTVGVGRNLEGNGLSRNEMEWLIFNQEGRRNRFPKDIDTIDGETLFVSLIKDMKKHGITEHEATVLLDNDIYDCISQLESKIKWYKSAPEPLQEVLVNMCFNMGIKTLLTFKNTLWYMSIGEYEKASKNMLRSRWARQVKNRAIRLAERVRSINE